jgi:predicted metal-dependent hydrolase
MPKDPIQYANTIVIAGDFYKKGSNTQVFNDLQLGEVTFRKNTNAKRYIIRLQGDKIKVTIPLHGNYTEAKKFLLKNKQILIDKIQQQSTDSSPVIDDVFLRRQAHVILPAKLSKLAEKHSFSYQAVKIRKSRTRWGSCSSHKVINLSLYLLLLPNHLIEYVLLHELCHTIQMNHSSAFWDLLNQCTQHKAKELQRELCKYRIPNG